VARSEFERVLFFYRKIAKDAKVGKGGVGATELCQLVSNSAVFADWGLRVSFICGVRALEGSESCFFQLILTGRLAWSGPPK
jgi:hypothetical protein